MKYMSIELIEKVKDALYAIQQSEADMILSLEIIGSDQTKPSEEWYEREFGKVMCTYDITREQLIDCIEEMYTDTL